VSLASYRRLLLVTLTANANANALHTEEKREEEEDFTLVGNHRRGEDTSRRKRESQTGDKKVAVMGDA